VKTWKRSLIGVALAALGLALGLSLVVLRALHPKPGEWTVSLALPWRTEPTAVSAPTLMRWATHPLLLPRLADRVLTTRAGRWRLQSRADGSIEALCAPCRLQLDALGPAPVTVARARLTLAHRGADRYDGSLWLGEGNQPVVLTWQAELRADALHLQAELAPTPLREVVTLFAAEVPEAARASIDGRMALRVQARLAAAGLQIDRLAPVLSNVAVSGLGTEALIDADPLARCRPQPAAGRIEGWLPHAVIAAEDQRFAEHPGYELDAWLAAWKRNAAAPEALQGASTLTQQLAKILFTGDDRSATRKLREWLYAVEMERTLGKGRILQLYLAVVPWGDGVCGAEAAARHHLGKPANQLRPREAAWLASLLVNPDQQLRRWAQDEAASRERAVWVLAGMKRLPAARRESELDAFATWRPPIGRSVVH
jgi:hypothetical protein